MSEKFTKEEFNEYMNKIKHRKPFNEKEWDEYHYIIKGRVRESPNYQAYLDYIESDRIKRKKIIYEKFQFNHKIRENPIPIPTPSTEPKYWKIVDIMCCCWCSLFCILLILIPFLVSMR